jgi:hypothetical protein
MVLYAALKLMFGNQLLIKLTGVLTDLTAVKNQACCGLPHCDSHLQRFTD